MSVISHPSPSVALITEMDVNDGRVYGTYTDEVGIKVIPLVTKPRVSIEVQVGTTYTAITLSKWQAFAVGEALMNFAKSEVQDPQKRGA